MRVFSRECSRSVARWFAFRPTWDDATSLRRWYGLHMDCIMREDWVLSS